MKPQSQWILSGGGLWVEPSGIAKALVIILVADRTRTLESSRKFAPRVSISTR